jgi:hypothetical protein
VNKLFLVGKLNVLQRSETHSLGALAVLHRSVREKGADLGNGLPISPLKQLDSRRTFAIVT